MTASAALPDVAADLARRWQDLARRHVTVTFGCACGAPVGHVSLADLEGDILAYLRHRYSPGLDAGLDSVFPAVASGPIRLLGVLRSVASSRCDPSRPVVELVTDIQRSIASCELSAMGRRRGLRADIVS